jgi:acyl-CoA reductase-like NAD-dependent aldehyde dehydrogenase
MSNRQEIFGPVLTVVKAKDLDDALALINRNRCELRSSSLFQLCESSFVALSY